MKKNLLLSLLFVFFTLSIFSKGNVDKKSDEKFTVKVTIPSGGPAIALSKLIYEKTQFKDSVTEYEVVNGPDLLQARLISGEADIAVAATNFAAVMYEKNKSLVLGAPIIWGNLYCITSENISSVSDLRGKTVYSFGRGVTPDLTVREVLIKSGLEPDKDLNIQYLTSVADIPPAFLSGKATVAIVAEPMLSSIFAKKPDTKIVADIQKEWKKYFGDYYPQSSIIIKREFLKAHPEYVTKFLDSVKKAIMWVNSNPELAAEYSSKISTLPSVQILIKSIPGLNINFVDAKTAKTSTEKYFNILASYDPKFIGGKLPDDDFYHKHK